MDTTNMETNDKKSRPGNLENGGTRPSWSDPVEWARLGRGEKLEAVTGRFMAMSDLVLTPENLELVCITGATLARILDSAEESSTYSSMHDDFYTNRAYVARSKFLQAMHTRIHEGEFLAGVAKLVESKARPSHDESGDEMCVWGLVVGVLVAQLPRLLTLHLSTMQIDDNARLVGFHELLFNSTPWRGDPSVDATVFCTPRWLYEYTKQSARATATEAYPVSAAEIDYVKGLRRTRREISDLQFIVKAAKTLARAESL